MGGHRLHRQLLLARVYTTNAASRYRRDASPSAGYSRGAALKMPLRSRTQLQAALPADSRGRPADGGFIANRKTSLPRQRLRAIRRPPPASAPPCVPARPRRKTTDAYATSACSGPPPKCALTRPHAESSIIITPIDATFLLQVATDSRIITRLCARAALLADYIKIGRSHYFRPCHAPQRFRCEGAGHCFGRSGSSPLAAAYLPPVESKKT